jgi:transposase
MAAHLPSMETAKNLVSYNDRYVYVKTVSCELKGGHKAYAHIGLDIERKASESRKLFRRAKATSLPDREVHERISKHGMFVLLSTRRIAKDKILPTYYTRQQIEQIFDIGKNYADMTPLRVQGEDTFRGHLILTFIASVIVKKIQDKLIATQYNPISLFSNLRNQKCRVYEHQVITCEAFKKANDCYKLFGIKCPEVIQLR